MMWSKSHSNYNKLPENSPGIVDLYRSNDFVADSLDATLASSVKISADGKITVQNVGFVADLHIHPDLQLPDLKERCNVATTWDLYRLSTLLADNDTAPIPPKTFCLLDVDNTRTLQAKSTHTSHPWDTSAPLAKRNLEQPTRHIIIAAAEKCEIPQTTIESMEGVEQKKRMEQIKYDEKPTIAPISSLHRKFQKFTTAETQLMNYMSNFSNEELLDTDRSEVSSVKGLLTDNDWVCRRIRLSAIKRELISLREAKSVRKIQSQKRVELFHVFRGVLNFLNMYGYTYANFLLLCSVLYITFIMFDVLGNDTVERRYMIKMRSSGFLLKCYYYIMRLLEMPIF